MHEDIETALRDFLEDADTARILKDNEHEHARICKRMVAQYEDLFKTILTNHAPRLA
jgi:hypothetical protein